MIEVDEEMKEQRLLVKMNQKVMRVAASADWSGLVCCSLNTNVIWMERVRDE